MTSRESIAMHPHHQDKATLLERLIFNNRPVVIALCVLVSIWNKLGFKAAANTGNCAMRDFR